MGGGMTCYKKAQHPASTTVPTPAQATTTASGGTPARATATASGGAQNTAPPRVAVGHTLGLAIGGCFLVCCLCPACVFVVMQWKQLREAFQRPRNTAETDEHNLLRGARCCEHVRTYSPLC